jgi:hypothetical protein
MWQQVFCFAEYFSIDCLTLLVLKKEDWLILYVDGNDHGYFKTNLRKYRRNKVVTYGFKWSL